MACEYHGRIFCAQHVANTDPNSESTEDESAKDEGNIKSENAKVCINKLTFLEKNANRKK